MDLPRICTGAAASLLVLTIWLGACGENQTVTCGDGGEHLGVCIQADSCPAGQGLINDSDPSDACPATYICCGSFDAGGVATPDGGSGGSTATDAPPG